MGRLATLRWVDSRETLWWSPRSRLGHHEKGCLAGLYTEERRGHLRRCCQKQEAGRRALASLPVS